MGRVGCGLARAVAAGSVVFLAGCAAVGDVQPSAKELKPNSMLVAHVQGKPHGWVTVTRNSRFAYGGCDVALSVRGVPVADLASGTRVRFPLPAGDHVLRAHFARSGFCPGQVLTLPVKLAAGEELQVVYDVHSLDGQHVFQLAY